VHLANYKGLPVAAACLSLVLLQIAAGVPSCQQLVKEDGSFVASNQL
jgi:hypothetical protein